MAVSPVTVKYDGKAPWGEAVPFVSIDREPLFFGGKWGQVVNVTLNGQLAIGLNADCWECTTAGAPDGTYYMGVQNDPIECPSGISVPAPQDKCLQQSNWSMPYPKGLKILEDARDEIISTFSKTLKTFEFEDSETPPNKMSFSNTVVESVDFPESGYHALLEYVVRLKCYEHDYFLAQGIVDPLDEFSLTEGEDGSMTVAHNISARGVDFTINGATKNGLDNAIEWVNMRMGECNMSDAGTVTAWDGGTGAGKLYLVLLNQTEKINRLEGEYGITENFIAYLDEDNAVEGIKAVSKYSISIKQSLEQDFTVVDITGEIKGGKNTTLQELRDAVAKNDDFITPIGKKGLWEKAKEMSGLDGTPPCCTTTTTAAPIPRYASDEAGWPPPPTYWSGLLCQMRLSSSELVDDVWTCVGELQHFRLSGDAQISSNECWMMQPAVPGTSFGVVVVARKLDEQGQPEGGAICSCGMTQIMEPEDVSNIWEISSCHEDCQLCEDALPASGEPGTTTCCSAEFDWHEEYQEQKWETGVIVWLAMPLGSATGKCWKCISGALANTHWEINPDDADGPGGQGLGAWEECTCCATGVTNPCVDEKPTPMLHRIPTAYSLDENESEKIIKVKATFDTNPLFVDENGNETRHYFDHEIDLQIDEIKKTTKIKVSGSLEVRGLLTEKKHYLDDFLDGTDIMNFLWEKAMIQYELLMKVCFECTGVDPDTGGPIDYWVRADIGDTAAEAGILCATHPIYGGTLIDPNADPELCHELNTSAESISITRNPNQGTLQMSATFSDEDFLRIHKTGNIGENNKCWECHENILCCYPTEEWSEGGGWEIGDLVTYKAPGTSENLCYKVITEYANSESGHNPDWHTSLVGSNSGWEQCACCWSSTPGTTTTVDPAEDTAVSSDYIGPWVPTHQGWSCSSISSVFYFESTFNNWQPELFYRMRKTDINGTPLAGEAFICMPGAAPGVWTDLYSIQPAGQGQIANFIHNDPISGENLPLVYEHPDYFSSCGDCLNPNLGYGGVPLRWSSASHPYHHLAGSTTIPQGDYYWGSESDALAYCEAGGEDEVLSTGGYISVIENPEQICEEGTYDKASYSVNVKNPIDFVKANASGQRPNNNTQQNNFNGHWAIQNFGIKTRAKSSTKVDLTMRQDTSLLISEMEEVLRKQAEGLLISLNTSLLQNESYDVNKNISHKVSSADSINASLDRSYIPEESFCVDLPEPKGQKQCFNCVDEEGLIVGSEVYARELATAQQVCNQRWNSSTTTTAPGATTTSTTQDPASCCDHDFIWSEEYQGQAWIDGVVVTYAGRCWKCIDQLIANTYWETNPLDADGPGGQELGAWEECTCCSAGTTLIPDPLTAKPCKNCYNCLGEDGKIEDQVQAESLFDAQLKCDENAESTTEFTVATPCAMGTNTKCYNCMGLPPTGGLIYGPFNAVDDLSAQNICDKHANSPTEVEECTSETLTCYLCINQDTNASEGTVQASSDSHAQTLCELVFKDLFDESLPPLVIVPCENELKCWSCEQGSLSSCANSLEFPQGGHGTAGTSAINQQPIWQCFFGDPCDLSTGLEYPHSCPQCFLAGDTITIDYVNIDGQPLSYSTTVQSTNLSGIVFQQPFGSDPGDVIDADETLSLSLEMPVQENLCPDCGEIIIEAWTEDLALIQCGGVLGDIVNCETGQPTTTTTTTTTGGPIRQEEE